MFAFSDTLGKFSGVVEVMFTRPLLALDGERPLPLCLGFCWHNQSSDCLAKSVISEKILRLA